MLCHQKPCSRLLTDMGICFVSVANGTETVAVPQDDGTYRLYGYKWFSSATDADVTLTLARVQNSDGSTVPVSTSHCRL